ncbi:MULTISPECIES: MetQ/NlpA family ABC transporter substrate-binding protein [unclassified Brenneria]|uniref:MetQ/NlpA family ABC transporter substrate-binding protein n=1 Tax=unclassified Brenneria TaxID=2634434 RepID=UPI0029C12D49|nr:MULTISPECIES: MetQ/NlpA family ABC transporter substrate-binding protein [unclassified Brenneria]MDX5629371.1 MetQ/NlpA family ABC transporter substrate-binding protein [Brenneria sp. L3-3Z]MDX5696466.1 MetQ/NlpA family ABC transporter substrate-binding protein [Brenneria sp. L4-2C]
MKKTLLLVLSLASALTSPVFASQPQHAGKPQKIVIGVIAREQPDIDYVAQKLKPAGYDIRVQVFNDNIALNHATADGSIDANYFQNEKYLNSFNQSNGTRLVAYGPNIYTTPVVFVSKKHKDVNAFPDGAKIGIANDSANRARELALLAANGLIKLRPGVELPTLLDITENPKNLKFIEIDPRSRVGAFADLDAMTAPSITVYQMADPDVTIETALFEETPDVYKQYGGVLLAIPEGSAEKNKPWLDSVVEVLSSKEYAEWLLKTYHGVKKPYNL